MEISYGKYFLFRFVYEQLRIPHQLLVNMYILRQVFLMDHTANIDLFKM